MTTTFGQRRGVAIRPWRVGGIGACEGLSPAQTNQEVKELLCCRTLRSENSVHYGMRKVQQQTIGNAGIGSGCRCALSRQGWPKEQERVGNLRARQYSPQDTLFSREVGRADREESSGPYKELYRTVFVSGIPPSLYTLRQVECHFHSPKWSGGDESAQVELLGNGLAFVTFSTPEVAKEVSSRRQEFSDEGQESYGLTVVPFLPSKFAPSQIMVSKLPTNVTREDLTAYFGSVRASGGGSVQNVELSNILHQAIITFTKQSVVTVLCEKGRTHVVLGQTVEVCPFQSTATLLVTDLTSGHDRRACEQYFGKDKTGQNVFMWDQKSCAALLAYHTADAALDVLSKQTHSVLTLMSNKAPLQVERYALIRAEQVHLKEASNSECEGPTQEQTSASRSTSVLLLDVPDQADDETIQHFCCAAAQTHDLKLTRKKEFGRVLVKFDSPVDIHKLEKYAAESRLFKLVHVRHVPASRTVRITNTPVTLRSVEIIKMYFKANFACMTIEDIVIKKWSQSIDVTFSSPEEARQILECEHKLNETNLTMTLAIEGFDFAAVEDLSDDGNLLYNTCFPPTKFQIKLPYTTATLLYNSLKKQSDARDLLLKVSAESVFTQTHIQLTPLEGAKKIIGWESEVRRFFNEVILNPLTHRRVSVPNGSLFRHPQLCHTLRQCLRRLEDDLGFVIDLENGCVLLTGDNVAVNFAVYLVNCVLVEGHQIASQHSRTFEIQRHLLYVCDKFVLRELSESFPEVSLTTHLSERSQAELRISGQCDDVLNASGKVQELLSAVEEVDCAITTKQQLTQANNLKAFAQGQLNSRGLRAVASAAFREGHVHVILSGFATKEELQGVKDDLFRKEREALSTSTGTYHPSEARLNHFEDTLPTEATPDAFQAATSTLGPQRVGFGVSNAESFQPPTVTDQQELEELSVSNEQAIPNENSAECFDIHSQSVVDQEERLRCTTASNHMEESVTPVLSCRRSMNGDQTTRNDQSPNTEAELSHQESNDHVDEASRSADNVDEAPPSADNVDEAPRSADNVDEAPSRADNVDEAPRSADNVDEAPPSAGNVDEAPPSADNVDEAPHSADNVDEASRSAGNVDEASRSADNGDEAPSRADNVDEAPSRADNVDEAPRSVDRVDGSFCCPDTERHSSGVSSEPFGNSSSQVKTKKASRRDLVCEQIRQQRVSRPSRLITMRKGQREMCFRPKQRHTKHRKQNVCGPCQETENRLLQEKHTKPEICCLPASMSEFRWPREICLPHHVTQAVSKEDLQEAHAKPSMQDKSVAVSVNSAVARAESAAETKWAVSPKKEEFDIQARKWMTGKVSRAETGLADSHPEASLADSHPETNLADSHPDAIEQLQDETGSLGSNGEAIGFSCLRQATIKNAGPVLLSQSSKVGTTDHKGKPLPTFLSQTSCQDDNVQTASPRHPASGVHNTNAREHLSLPIEDCGFASSESPSSITGSPALHFRNAKAALQRRFHQLSILACRPKEEHRTDVRCRQTTSSFGTGRLSTPTPSVRSGQGEKIDGVCFDELSPVDCVRIVDKIADDFSSCRTRLIRHLLGHKGNEELSMKRASNASGHSEHDLLCDGIHMWLDKEISPTGRALYDAMVDAGCPEGRIMKYKKTLKLPHDYNGGVNIF